MCAGLADMARPAEKLSTGQSAVLMATGKAKLTLFSHRVFHHYLPTSTESLSFTMLAVTIAVGC